MGIVGSSEVTGNVSFQNLPINIERTDEVLGFGDLYPQASLSWNAGVNNYKLYVTGDIQWVYLSDPDRLADIGIGHGVIDWGGAYTYLNPETSHELSATLGFTFNFENNRLPERYRYAPRLGCVAVPLQDNDGGRATSIISLRTTNIRPIRLWGSCGSSFLAASDRRLQPLARNSLRRSTPVASRSLGGHSVGWSLSQK